MWCRTCSGFTPIAMPSTGGCWPSWCRGRSSGSAWAGRRPSVVPEAAVTLLVGVIGVAFALNLILRKPVVVEPQRAEVAPGLFWGGGDGVHQLCQPRGRAALSGLHPAAGADEGGVCRNIDNRVRDHQRGEAGALLCAGPAEPGQPEAGGGAGGSGGDRGLCRSSAGQADAGEAVLPAGDLGAAADFAEADLGRGTRG